MTHKPIHVFVLYGKCIITATNLQLVIKTLAIQLTSYGNGFGIAFRL
jgi:hypothetical protein